MESNIDFGKEIHLKVYTKCSLCDGKGQRDYIFMPKTCPVCKGIGKNEKFITLEELKNLLQVSSL